MNSKTSTFGAFLSENEQKNVLGISGEGTNHPFISENRSSARVRARIGLKFCRQCAPCTRHLPCEGHQNRTTPPTWEAFFVDVSQAMGVWIAKDICGAQGRLSNGVLNVEQE